MKLVVVGGVAGGMSFAARARRLDEHAEIIVLERGEHVSFANCGLPYYVGGEITNAQRLLVETPQTLAASFNLDVRTGHDVTSVDTDAKTVTVETANGTEVISYDKLILSPGARAIRPNIPGIDTPRAHTLRTIDDALALREGVDAGLNSAVILGAGFIGLEAAEALARQDLEVSIVERAGHVLPPLESEIAFPVTEELRRLGIKVYSGVAATEIIPGEDEDIVVLEDGTRIPTQMIELSVGVRPDIAPFTEAGIESVAGAIRVDERGRTSAPDVWAVGDAVASVDAVTGAVRPVALAGPANRAGRLVADFIIRPEKARKITPTLGTAIVRVGDLAAAVTGANRASLREAGIDFTTLHLHPHQHATYFPGAEMMSLLVHIDSGDGRILGAQAVGPAGIDKRIDILATAIRSDYTVGDLIDLDLAYSPPFGMAKDPVNFVGMVGTNVLDGTLKLWYADQLEKVRETSFILDVRPPADFAREHIPGSLNVPLAEVRANLDPIREEAQGKPIAVLCVAGVRSAIAHRILVQNGFESASLSGGILTLKETLGDAASEVLVSSE